MQQQFQTDTGVKTRVINAKDKLVDSGKDAFQTGLDVAAGQAALAVLRSFVVPAKVSLVDKLTGKGAFIKKVANSTYGSLAIAAVFHVGVSMIAPKNQKLNKVAQLALNAAMVEAASTLPIQQWVDKVANKLFSNNAISQLLDSEKTED